MQSYSVGKYGGKEEVFVDSVRQCGDFTNDKNTTQKACIVFRVSVVEWNISLGPQFRTGMT